jgi:hypothetical protein
MRVAKTRVRGRWMGPLTQFLVAAVLVMALWPGPATAQEQDRLGVFFDAAGTVDRVKTLALYEPVDCYLVLMNPSEASGVSGWECIVELMTDGPAVQGGWTLTGSAINIDTPPRFSVGLGTALPWSETIVLATGTLFVPEPIQEIEIYLHSYDPPSLLDPPGFGYPVYAPVCVAGDDPNHLIPLGWAAGCEGDPVAIINDDTASQPNLLDFWPASLNFDWVPVGGNRTLDLTFRNNTSLILSGKLQESSDFFWLQLDGQLVSDRVQFQLRPGQQKSVQVTFNALTADEHTADLVFSQCDQVLGTISCIGNSENPICLISPEALDFGTLLYGEPRARTFTITNDGGGLLTGSVGELCDDFDITAGGGAFSLGTGQSRDVVVYFQAFAAGEYTCDVEVTGLGCPDVVCTATVETSPPVCSITPTFLDFGEVAVGTSRVMSFTIRNLGGEPFSGNIPQTCGPFSVVGGTAGSFTVYPSSSRQVFVEFEPEYAGVVECTLDLGAGICSPVELTGTGWTQVVCQLSPTSLNFGAVDLGSSAERTLTITNLGSEPLTGSLPSECGDFTVTQGAGGFELLPGQSRVARIRFAPTEIGPRSCLLEIEGLCEPVPLSGNCTLPSACVVSPIFIDFGPVPIGEQACRPFFISNTGQTMISGSVQEMCTAFAISQGGGSYALAPGDTHHVEICFTPPVAGPFTCQITTGSFECSSVFCEGQGASQITGSDVAGLFFDEFGLQNWAQSYGEAVTLYLCLLNASAPSGVSGWECRVEWTGDLMVLGWHPRGVAINVATPPEFVVGLGAPLPWQPSIVLMDFQVFSWTSGPRLFYLHPVAVPSLPGSMVYAAGSDPGSLIPMNWPTGDENDPVAILDYDSPLGTETKPPLAQATGGGVRLTWTYDDGAVDGFHVYRRFGSEPTERLTAAPIAGDGGQAEYMDPATGYPASTVLRYSYGMIKNGAEIARSGEVAVTLAGGVPHGVVLHPNYPNPFNPITHIEFELQKPGQARLEIFDLSGRKVRTLADEDLGSGRHERTWQGRDDRGRLVPSGAYYCRLEAGGVVEMQKMVLLK